MLSRAGTHRYGIVLAIVLAQVLFLVLAPTTTWSRTISLVLQGTVLLAVIMTSRQSEQVRTRATIGAAAIVVAIAVLASSDVLPKAVTIALGAVIVLAPLPTLCTQLIRMMRTTGVTVEALAGALAVYLLVGTLFALVVGIMAESGSAPYFTNGTDGDTSTHVYFSFTTLTTTGYGDLTAASRQGHGLAVLEMLFGQIYLVTIIGLLVGNLRSRRADEAAQAAEKE